MSDDVFPNIQRKYSLRKRELGKQHMKGFQMALKNPDAYNNCINLYVKLVK